MATNQTKNANLVRTQKKNEQDYHYKELFKELVKEHADKEFICDDCMDLNFCGEKNHPTADFLAATLTTLGYPTPRQVEKLGLRPYNLVPEDLTEEQYREVRSSIDLGVWDPKQVRRILSNRNAYPVSPLEAFFIYDDD